MLHSSDRAPARPLTWRNRSGAWLAIGTSPGAFVLGAQLAELHGGAIPLAGLLIGAAAMALLLYLQGRLGLMRAPGLAMNFVELTREYLSSWSRRVIGAAIAISVTGWVAFAIGIGAESLTRLVDTDQVTGSLILGVTVLLMALAGINRWNGVAVFTTLVTLLLAAIVVFTLDDKQVPVSVDAPEPRHVLVDIAVLVGYIAVFSVRAPDFTHGMARRLDAWVCIVLLIVPALALAMVGGVLFLVAGGQDGEALASLGAVRFKGVGVGDALLVLAILAPAVTSAYSGGMSLQIFTGTGLRTGILAIVVLSIVAGAVNFQDHLIPYLMLVAATLPSAALPFSVEVWARKAGAVRRLIPWWTWAPGSMVGALLFIASSPLATLAALSLAGMCSMAYGIARWREVRGDPRRQNEDPKPLGGASPAMTSTSLPKPPV